MPESLSRSRGLVGEITFIAPIHTGYVSRDDLWGGRPEPSVEETI